MLTWSVHWFSLVWFGFGFGLGLVWVWFGFLWVALFRFFTGFLPSCLFFCLFRVFFFVQCWPASSRRRPRTRRPRWATSLASPAASNRCRRPTSSGRRTDGRWTTSTSTSTTPATTPATPATRTDSRPGPSSQLNFFLFFYVLLLFLFLFLFCFFFWKLVAFEIWRFSSVSVSIRVQCRFLPGFIGSYRVLLAFTGFYELGHWITATFQFHFRVWRLSACFYRVSQGFTGLLPSFVWIWSVFTGFLWAGP